MLRRSLLSCVTVAVVAVAGPPACGLVKPSQDSSPAASTPTAPSTPAAPAPTPAAFVCPLGKGTGPGTNCPHTVATLGAYVNAAIDKTMDEHPEYFDFNVGVPGFPGVKEHDKYQKTVVDNLNKMGGICAKDDGEEIAIKSSNDFNEQWNIWYSLGQVRRSYITTCSPASF